MWGLAFGAPWGMGSPWLPARSSVGYRVTATWAMRRESMAMITST